MFILSSSFFIIATLYFKATIHQFKRNIASTIIVKKKLVAGGIEPLKAIKLLLEEGKVDSDCILMLDEMYLQK